MEWDNARRSFQNALVWISAAALVFLLWQIREAFLLAFAAGMLAILLRTFALLIARWIHVSEHAALALATSVILAVIAGTVWLFGTGISTQFNQLLQHIEAGEESLRKLLESRNYGGLGSQVTQQGITFATDWIRSALSSGLRFIEITVVVTVSAVYFAAQPQLYQRGIAALFPPRLRPRVTAVMDLIARTLTLWIFGQLVLMLSVGILSFVAVWLIGLPNPGALGLIAGLTEIVPYLGPFIGAIPAIFVALTQGVSPALWTAGSYLVIHLVEGYVCSPILQRYFVTIPPALVLIGIVAVDLVFGTIGIVLGAPIAVLTYIVVKMAYVEDPLEEHTERHFA
jgi:predicted PurR-regulated permease PerM